MIKLVATDLDGTLLRTDKTVSEYTKRIIRDLVDSGIQFVPASGRQLFSMRNVLRQIEFTGTVVSANGAAVVDVPSEIARFVTELQPDPMRRVVDLMIEQVPGLVVAAVRDLGRVLVAEPGYVELMLPGDHDRNPEDVKQLDLAGVCSEPSVKTLLRTTQVSVAEMYEFALTLDVEHVSMTDAGAPFLEVMGPGVTKQSAIAQLCESLDIAPSEVMAFGDWVNDLELLRWAGVGVAVENAHPDAIAAADRVTAANDDDGVARLLAELLL